MEDIRLLKEVLSTERVNVIRDFRVLKPQKVQTVVACIVKPAVFVLLIGEDTFNKTDNGRAVILVTVLCETDPVSTKVIAI